MESVDNSSSTSSSNAESIEVNNQLGISNIYDELTMNHVEDNINIGMRGPHTDVVQTADRNNDILSLLRQLNEQQKQTNDKIDKTNEQQKQANEQQKMTNNKLDQTNEKIDQTNKKVDKFMDEMTQKFEDMKRENQERFERERAETTRTIKEASEILKQHTDDKIDKIEQTMQQNQQNITTEFKSMNKRIMNNSKQQEERLENHKEEVNKRVKEGGENWERKISDLERSLVRNNEEIDGRIHQIQEDVRQVTQVGTVQHRVIPTDLYKNVTFTGESEYPMEFLKELKEIHREYYQSGSISWIARYLDAEASIWWRLIKDSVKNFQDFEEAFIAKYWNNIIQEGIRDRLEFGRYRREDGLTMIQYMERRVLENRQLIPRMEEQHLIRKLARHFNHNIEVAIITRGVTTMQEFQQILCEFMNLRNNPNRNVQTTTHTKSETLTDGVVKVQQTRGESYNTVDNNRTNNYSLHPSKTDKSKSGAYKRVYEPKDNAMAGQSTQAEGINNTARFSKN